MFITSVGYAQTTTVDKLIAKKSVSSPSYSISKRIQIGVDNIIYLDSGIVFDKTLTGHTTLTFDVGTLQNNKWVTVFIKTGVGGFTITFTGVHWINNNPPTLTTSANKMAMYSFYNYDGTIFGADPLQPYDP